MPADVRVSRQVAADRIERLGPKVRTLSSRELAKSGEVVGLYDLVVRAKWDARGFSGQTTVPFAPDYGEGQIGSEELFGKLQKQQVHDEEVVWKMGWAKFSCRLTSHSSELLRCNISWIEQS